MTETENSSDDSGISGDHTMGGDGSGGNRGWQRTRRLVESCIWLDSRQILTKEVHSVLTRREGRVEMTVSWGGVTFCLTLKFADSGRTVLDIYSPAQRFEVVRSRLTYGDRFFFRCPCGRRCLKVYLPRNETYYKCRVCYRLTQNSCNESRPEFWRTLMRLERLRLG